MNLRFHIYGVIASAFSGDLFVALDDFIKIRFLGDRLIPYADRLFFGGSFDDGLITVTAENKTTTVKFLSQPLMLTSKKTRY